MDKIENKEDLPRHIQIFAKTLEGELSDMPSTNFWEAKTIDEFEKGAHEIGYEIIPTLDLSTGRGFLVGFEARESKIIMSGLSGVGLDMYFIEVDESEFNLWTDKIKQHRDDQEQDMLNRRALATEKQRSK